MFRRRPRVEEIENLNLHEQAEKDFTITHSRGVRPGLYGDLVLTGETVIPDYPEDSKRSKARECSARNVRVPSRLLNIPDQGRSW